MNLPGLDHETRRKIRAYASLIRRSNVDCDMTRINRLRPIVAARGKVYDGATEIQSASRLRRPADKTEGLEALHLLDEWSRQAIRHTDVEHISLGRTMVEGVRTWASREKERPARRISMHVLRGADAVEKVIDGLSGGTQ